MPRLEAVIFDMDGLMIDSEGKQSLALEQLLREHGAEPVRTVNGIVHVAGIRAKENLRHLKKRHDIKTPLDDLHARKNELYSQMLTQGVTPMAGLEALLSELRKAPVKKALASGSAQQDIALVLGHLKLEGYFDAIVSGYEVPHGKPAPDIFLEAAKRLGINPERCVVLEDSGTGVQAAKAAGMKVVAVPNQYTEDHDFGAADLIVASLSSLGWKRLQEL